MPAMRRIKRIHLIGIGGSGMCGIAEVLRNQGYRVSGSDLKYSPTIERLQKLGIQIFIDHSASHVEGADVVVYSSAVQTDNVEYVAAKEQHIPLVRRAEMLGELMRFRYGISIAGTHGKTTTTSLIASILTEAGFDPTFVIGGRLNRAFSNAGLGKGRFFVAEADESDASFLHLQPMITVVTNIDFDHMETYSGQPEILYQTFLQYLHNLPFYGLAVMCADDLGVQHVLSEIHRPLLTYGFSDNVDVQAIDVEMRGLKTFFKVRRRQVEEDLSIELNMPGRHNILNALAAIAVASEEGVTDDVIQRALMQFEGVGRRFQVYPDVMLGQNSCTIVDDYGHHPRELEATIAAARAAWPDRRILMVFQPHRFTRTRDLYEDFVRVLSTVEELFILDVYAAGEAPIVNA
ncbi:MAG: UDP-N-acetylmuramate--L-alanine ligase, partial [Pseudomonadota bacterium]